MHINSKSLVSDIFRPHQVSAFFQGLVASNTVDLPVENGTDLTRASIASMASRLSSDSAEA
jgi:hypothetical protein